MLQQNKENHFEFPLTVDIFLTDGTKIRKQWNVKFIEEKWIVQSSQPITKIILDPEQTLLFK